MALEGETIIFMKNSTEICFDKKMANSGGEGFIPTAKFYKSAKDAALLDPEKKNLEWTSDVHL